MSRIRLAHIGWHGLAVAVSCALSLLCWSWFGPALTDDILPTDFPPEAGAGLLQLRKDTRREGVMTRGLEVVRSPILSRSLPAFCFVRVTYPIRTVANARSAPVRTFALSLKGAPQYRFECIDDILRFLATIPYQVTSISDAEDLRKLLRTTQPHERHIPLDDMSVTVQGPEGERWRVVGTGQKVLTVTVDAEGFVLDRNQNK